MKRLRLSRMSLNGRGKVEVVFFVRFVWAALLILASLRPRLGRITFLLLIRRSACFGVRTAAALGVLVIFVGESNNFFCFCDL